MPLLRRACAALACAALATPPEQATTDPGLGELLEGGAQRWEVGEAEAQSKGYVMLMPDRAAVARSCATLQGR